MNKQDIRWIQRFSNFRKAMEKFKDAINEYNEEDMSELEKEKIGSGNDEELTGLDVRQSDFNAMKHKYISTAAK